MPPQPCRHHLPLLSGALLAIGLAMSPPQPGRAHGAAGGEELLPGSFRMAPVLTIEGHAGLEDNLEGQPRHYALDGLLGVVLEWGLPNRGSLAIEAMLGPALVWGEAEHFYGRVHREAPGGHGEPHDAHAEDTHDAHAVHKEHEEHGDHDDHGPPGDAHDPHAQDAPHGHSHSHDGAPFRRTDIKGQLQVRYDPNDRLSFSVAWMPYYVTRSQEDDIKGLKNELLLGVVWALGDGDVNFALGDGLEAIADGFFLSLQNRTGWESDGLYLGNYTDPWLGFGFRVDQLSVTLSAGPRFYSPGRYAGLDDRTDWGGEVELEVPLGPRTVFFAHWQPIYTSQNGEGWGLGWQHHIGSGVTFRF
jgi:hypothetical protein